MKVARSNLRSAAIVYKKSLLKFIGSSPGSIFSYFNCKGVKLLIRLRLGHLRVQKFKQSFGDTLNRLFWHGRNMEPNMDFSFQLTLV